MPRPEKTISGPKVLAVVLGLTIFISVGVMLIAFATRRTPAAPPTLRTDTTTLR